MRKKKYYKRISLLAMLLLMNLFTMQVLAGIDGRVVDGSVLTQEVESESEQGTQTRGVYLKNGYCKIVNRGGGQIAAGGTTTANGTVAKVGVGVIVEQYNESTDEWDHVESWQFFRENAMSASSSKILDVEGGYYYRVRATHSANSDLSSSYSNGIYIE